MYHHYLLRMSVCCGMQQHVMVVVVVYDNISVSIGVSNGLCGAGVYY